MSATDEDSNCQSLDADRVRGARLGVVLRARLAHLLEKAEREDSDLRHDREQDSMEWHA